MSADTLDKQPMLEAPRDGSWVQLLFSDALGHWWSKAPYRFNGSRWSAASGHRAPSHLSIIGWRNWKGEE